MDVNHILCMNLYTLALQTYLELMIHLGMQGMANNCQFNLDTFNYLLALGHILQSGRHFFFFFFFLTADLVFSNTINILHNALTQISFRCKCSQAE